MEVFELADVDMSGTLSEAEYKQAFKTDEVKERMALLGFPIETDRLCTYLQDLTSSDEITRSGLVRIFLLVLRASRGDALAESQLAAMRQHANHSRDFSLYPHLSTCWCFQFQVCTIPSLQ